MSDSEDESNLPSAAECQKAIDNFVQITNTDEALAQFYLQDHKWSVESAVGAFFSESDSNAAAVGADQSSPGIVVSTKAPNKLTVLTWNIDGLSDKNLKARYQEVAKIIEANQFSIVFLQEVVSEALRYFDETLENYSIFSAQEECDYFTAILMRTGAIYLDEDPVIVPFPSTRMGRNLMLVRAHVGKAKLVLMNSHLESTMDHSGERLKQLKMCFKYLLDEDPSEVNVVFGGDLNLRDKELDEIGGMPFGVQDLWIATGSRPECRYTWDMTRNTNLEYPGRFKPRCRFDRLYFRSTTPVQIKPTHFGLIGIEKVAGSQSFPSDHWGITASFEIPVNK